MYVCISTHLPRFQEVEIEALSSRKNLDQSGIDVEEKLLFRVESHIFAGEESSLNASEGGTNSHD